MEKLSLAFYTGSVCLGLAAGGVMAMQPAVNSRLATGCTHPLQASLVSFGTGFLALLGVCLVLRTGLPNLPHLANNLPGWAWTGGLMGTYMVTVSLLVAPKIGAVRWIALVLAGQITLSLIFDHFGALGYAQHSISVYRLIGITLVVAGVVLVMRN